MMKIAIPIFGARVSPRFDFAPALLICTLENGRVVERTEMPINTWSIWQRVEKMKELQVQTLICGGIDGNSERILKSQQIEVIPWVAGEAEKALQTFLKGKLQPGMIIYPGCGRRRHRWAQAYWRRRI